LTIPSQTLDLTLKHNGEEHPQEPLWAQPTIGPIVHVIPKPPVDWGRRIEHPGVVVEAVKKPRKPRRRKEVTVDKFLVGRVTQDLYDKVQAASDQADVDTSKWLRRAITDQLNKQGA